MDFKKAYKEALERAKVGMPLDEVFPELKESEDERIRKILIHIVKGACDKYGIKYEGDEIGQEKLLAYLEKQKEQKPVHTAKEMWKEMRLEVYAQASGNRHEPNYSDDSTKMFSLCDIDEIFEKIGDSTVGSQPAEWSEEDEKMLVAISKALGCDTAEKILVNEGVTLMLAAGFLDSLRPQPHWKPSEEQMKALLSKLPVVKGSGDKVQDILESLYNDLKKLM